MTDNWYDHFAESVAHIGTSMASDTTTIFRKQPTRNDKPMTETSPQFQIADLLSIVKDSVTLAHEVQAIPALAQRVAEAATNPEKFAKRLAKLQSHIADGKQTFDELLELVNGIAKAVAPADPGE